MPHRDTSERTRPSAGARGRRRTRETRQFSRAAAAAAPWPRGTTDGAEGPRTDGAEIGKDEERNRVAGLSRGGSVLRDRIGLFDCKYLAARPAQTGAARRYEPVRALDRVGTQPGRRANGALRHARFARAPLS